RSAQYLFEITRFSAHGTPSFAAYWLSAKFAAESAPHSTDRNGSRSFPRPRRSNDRRNPRGRQPPRHEGVDPPALRFRQRYGAAGLFGGPSTCPGRPSRLSVQQPPPPPPP